MSLLLKYMTVLWVSEHCEKINNEFLYSLVKSPINAEIMKCGVTFTVLHLRNHIFGWISSIYVYISSRKHAFLNKNFLTTCAQPGLNQNVRANVYSSWRRPIYDVTDRCIVGKRIVHCIAIATSIKYDKMSAEERINHEKWPKLAHSMRK